jgi:nitrate reductase delta subunit
MATTFKVLSALLSYPTEETVAAAPELAAALAAEKLVAAPSQAALERLLAEFAAGDLFDLQERYVLLFDRTRSLSLYLFEHVHGESRDRGQAMVDLAELYRRHGLEIAARELPDYLPLFLEYLSTRTLDEARDLLGQTVHILAALGRRLAKRGSPYASVFAALEALAGKPADGASVAAVLAEPDDDPDDLGALDAAWAEEPVRFGPGAAGQGAAGQDCPRAADILARMAGADAARPAAGRHPAK